MANNKNITFDQLQAALSRVKNALDGKANTNHGNHVPNIETANGARFLRNDNTWQTITPVDIGAAAVSHNHTSLTGITDLQFAATPSDYAAIKVTSDGAASTCLDFEMNDDANADMYRWRFSTWDASVSATTDYFDLMTLTAKDISSAILTVNGDVTASSFIGNATSATKLQTAKTLTIGNASRYFDGSANVTWSLSDIGAAADSHTHGSYTNQNAFTNVKIGDTIIEADSPTDTLTLNAGANVTITPDVINDTVTIESRDTIYTHPTNPGNRHIPSGGSSGQILRWSEDGTAAWGSENNSFASGSVGGFTVTPNNLVGNNVGITSSLGHGYAFWAGVNGAENSESAPFKVGHEGKLYAYNAVLAGTLDGNATTATRLQTARKFTIGNSEKYFDGSTDVAWTLEEIGASSNSHMHTSIDHLGDVPAQSTGERPSKNGISMNLAYSNGYPYTYGNVLNLRGSGDSQLFVGWSGTTGGDAPVYVRSKRDAGDEWSRWAMLYSEAYPQPSVTGNAGTATRLQTARTFTIGNTSRSFDGQHDVAWSLNDIGAADLNHAHNYVPISSNSSIVIRADEDASSTEEYIQLQAGHNYLRVTSSAGGGTVTQGADKLIFNGNAVYHTGNKPIAADIGALPLSGGAMTGPIQRSSFPGTWVSAAKYGNALINSTAPNGVYSPMLSGKTTNGSMVLAFYNNNLELTYLTKDNVDSEINAPSHDIILANESGGATYPGTVEASSFSGSLTGNASTATKLSAAKTLTIGNTGKLFDGSGNVSWTLDEIGAVSPSHTHDRIVGSMSNVTISQSDDRCGLEARNNVDIATWYGFSISNNCYNTDNYGQVTFSVDARSGQVWTRGTISAPTFSGALQGNATTATTLFNSRKFTIGNTEKYFNGSADVSWSLDEMGVTSAIAQKGDVILNTVNQQMNSAIDRAKSSVKMDMHHNYVSKHEAAHYFEGENKWKLDLYNMGSMDTMATPTKELMIQHNCQYLYSILVEHPSYTSAYGDTYVGYATTYMHFTEAYQWTGQVVTDDAGSVYLNDEFVLSTTSCQFKDITLNFRAGWNKLEVLYAEGGGGDGWQFNPEIIVVPGGTMNKMNCYGQNSTEEYIKANYSTKAETAETNNKINNIRIGGTNLFKGTTNLDSLYWIGETVSITDSYYKGSRIYRTSYAWADCNYPVSHLFADDVIELNTEYTFSCYARTNNDSYKPDLCIYGDPAHMEGHGLCIGTVGTEWRQYSGKIKIYDGDRSYPLRIEPTTESGDDNIYIEVCGLKLEKGNKATDWSPNPSDTAIVNPNLLKNGRFKEIRPNAVDNVPGWVATGGVKVWTSQGQPEYDRYGCIYFHKEVCNGSGCYLFQDLALDDIGRGVPLTLSFDAWTEGNIAEVGCNIEYFNADKTTMTASKNLNTNDFAPKTDGNGHRRYTFITDDNVHAKYLRIVFYYISVSGAAGGFLATIGNVKLEHGIRETAWLESQCENTTTNLNKGSGYNLLRNSRALNGTKYWVDNGGGIAIYSNNAPTVDHMYFNSQFPAGITYHDWIQLENNTHYIYSAKIYVPTSISFGHLTPLHFWSSSDKSAGQTQLEIIRGSHDGRSISPNQWVDVWIEFVTMPSGPVWFKPFIYHNDANCAVSVTDLMLCKGSTPSPWSPHPNEIYDGATRIDRDGVKILNTGISGNSFTHASYNGFTLHKDGENLLDFSGNGLYIKPTSGSIHTSLLSGTINRNIIETNTITSKELSISDFSNYSQLKPYENLSNRYGTAIWGGDAAHFYWCNENDAYLPFTINETPNPFKEGDKIGYKFDAYAGTDLDVSFGIWFYSDNSSGGYMIERTVGIHLYAGWNTYSGQINIDCAEARYARSIAILLSKGAGNRVEVRNVVISRAVNNAMIEDRSVTARKLGTIGGFQVEDRVLRGRNGTEGNNYAGMSGDGTEWAFWAGAYSGSDAPFHVGHEGHLWATNATLAGTLDGNATTATRLQSARTFTIGNTGKNFDGSGNIAWSLDEMGALPTAGGTVSGNLNVSGAFSVGGKKITINSSAPSSPAVGDIWIKI